MAIPRIFIASTCYDLKYVRENLKYFIKTLGYEPILSEEGAIFYDPSKHTHESCLSEVPNCQIFVLIIGGRSGGKYKGSKKSITNMEYEEAIRHKIPIFTLVEETVYAEQNVYLKNKLNSEVDEHKIVYPAVDNTNIFDFIDEVRKASFNNALHPFQDYSDMEIYLKQQWAGMMFSFLARENEEKRVSDTLKILTDMNTRIEMISKHILDSVGTDAAQLDVALYELMLDSSSIRDLTYWKIKPTPISIFVNPSFRTCAKSFGINLKIEEEEGIMIGSDGKISRGKFKEASNKYKKLRYKMTEFLKSIKITPEEYIKKSKK
ncbi:MAG: DUF4062 domain-containing protein [Planctomycetes bacterium]|nr:DUF4062 domain-containing protein [Planctomycetota bacterium]